MRAQPGYLKLAAELSSMSPVTDAEAPVTAAAPAQPLSEAGPSAAAPADKAGGNASPAAEATGEGDASAAAEGGEEPAKRSKYPLKVLYCKPSMLPAEYCSYLSKTQFEKCKPWLRTHAPEHFPDLFPEECAARLEALKLSAETGEDLVPDEDEEDSNEVKVAVPIEQKTSGGKKKKAAAEIVITLGQRKGKKQVTIVYGLDLFGIKLKVAAKTAKKSFATGSSITVVRLVSVYSRSCCVSNL